MIGELQQTKFIGGTDSDISKSVYFVGFEDFTCPKYDIHRPNHIEDTIYERLYYAARFGGFKFYGVEKLVSEAFETISGKYDDRILAEKEQKESQPSICIVNSFYHYENNLIPTQELPYLRKHEPEAFYYQGFEFAKKVRSEFPHIQLCINNGLGLEEECDKAGFDLLYGDEDFFTPFEILDYLRNQNEGLFDVDRKEDEVC